jgi:signal peptidase II
MVNWLKFHMNTKLFRIGGILFIIILCVGCDQATKSLAAGHLSFSDPVCFFNDILMFTYSENTGGFLSFGSSMPDQVRFLIFTILTSLFLAVILIGLFSQRHASAVSTLGASLIAGGGLGNLIDRVQFGHVRDFIIMGIGPLHTGVFNLADSAITLGAALVMLSVFRSEKNPNHSVQG